MNAVAASAVRWVTLALTIPVLTWGCASVPSGTPPMGDTMEQVRARTGLPNAMRFLASGEEVWEFNDARVSYSAWRVVFEPGGAVREKLPIRRPADVARVKTGVTTAPEVLEWLGEPAGVSFSGAAPVWEYRQPDGERLYVRFGAGRRVQDVAVRSR